MSNEKGLIGESTLDETPILEELPIRPLEEKKNEPAKVDINVLKSRIEKRRKKESKQTLIITFFFIICIGLLGIYLSL